MVKGAVGSRRPIGVPQSTTIVILRRLQYRWRALRMPEGDQGASALGSAANNPFWKRPCVSRIAQIDLEIPKRGPGRGPPCEAKGWFEDR